VLETNRAAITVPCALIAGTLALLSVKAPVPTILDWVRAFRETIGLPAVAPVSLPAADIPALVAGARAEALYLATNPKKVTDEEIAAAYRGALGH
jgi:alcohol dehydrogenase class IV